jgi:hypothetical protein
MALKQGHEVLFTTRSFFRENDIKLPDILGSVNIRDSPFLAVSSEFDTDLLTLVQSAQFAEGN